MTHDPNVYGYVNGEPTYSRDEFIYKARHRGPIESDAELLEYAREETSNWSSAGWSREFKDYFLSDYALARPFSRLTRKEFDRLKELQAEARRDYERAEAEREWKLIGTNYWADNSVEEIYEDKYGARKTVMVIGPHGDAC